MSHEVLQNHTTSYYLFDSVIEIDGSETAYGWQSFGIVDDETYYLGSKPVGLSTAIQLFESIVGAKLSESELQEVEHDNLPRVL